MLSPWYAEILNPILLHLIPFESVRMFVSICFDVWPGHARWNGRWNGPSAGHRSISPRVPSESQRHIDRRAWCRPWYSRSSLPRGSSNQGDKPGLTFDDLTDSQIRVPFKDRNRKDVELMIFGCSAIETGSKKLSTFENFSLNILIFLRSCREILPRKFCAESTQCLHVEDQHITSLDLGLAIIPYCTVISVENVGKKQL